MSALDDVIVKINSLGDRMLESELMELQEVIYAYGGEQFDLGWDCAEAYLGLA